MRCPLCNDWPSRRPLDGSTSPKSSQNTALDQFRNPAGAINTHLLLVYSDDWSERSERNEELLLPDKPINRPFKACLQAVLRIFFLNRENIRHSARLRLAPILIFPFSLTIGVSEANGMRNKFFSSWTIQQYYIPLNYACVREEMSL